MGGFHHCPVCFRVWVRSCPSEKYQSRRVSRVVLLVTSMGKGGADPKIIFHVRAFLGDWKKQRPPSEDAVLESLLSTHREYQRKPQGMLRKQLGKVLRQQWEKAESEELASMEDRRMGDLGGDGDGDDDDDDDDEEEEQEHRANGGGGGSNGGGGPKKRKRGGWTGGAAEDDEEQQEAGSDEEFEKEAKERERLLDGKGHNLLNNSLSAAYRAKALLASKEGGDVPGGAAGTSSSDKRSGGGGKSSSARLEGGGGGGDNKASETTKGRKSTRRKRTSEAPAGGSDEPPFPPPPSSSSSPMVAVERPSARYSDLAGIEQVLQDVRELIEYPLRYPEVYRHLGVEPPRGILLHGPPGCGKTLLANAVAGQLGVSFLRISAPEIVSGMSGESEQKVRELFQAAIESAPAIVFMDEVDAITQKRETSQRGMERRIVAQLLTCMDSLSLENTNGHPVLVIGATNRPDSLDPALRRAGRFDREIALGVPDQDARQRILQVMTKKMRLSGDFDFSLIAKKTPGYVGADLASLTKEAAVIAINRIFSTIIGGGEGGGGKEGDDEMVVAQEGSDGTTSGGGGGGGGGALPVSSAQPLSEDSLAGLSITMDDFLQAVSKVQPSSKREGFAAVPGVTWADVGALASVREELAMSIIEPISNPERFHMLGLSIPAGVLLFGPPGCGKTLLAKAIANESGANFISVKGPELLDKYVGESERAVRQVFNRARASSPCIIFFDELDALCPRRGSGGDGGSGVSERVVNQLLTEMDGLEGRRNVFVIAATNRPELIDSAMLRPGRLDKLLYVPLPGPSDRVSILRALCRKTALDADTVDLEALGTDSRADGYSGADLAALVHEAGIAVLKEIRRKEEEQGGKRLEGPFFIGRSHFESAFSTVIPSVSPRDQRRYLQTRANLSRARAAPAPTTTAAAAAEPPPPTPSSPNAAGTGQGDDVFPPPRDPENFAL